MTKVLFISLTKCHKTISMSKITVLWYFQHNIKYKLILNINWMNFLVQKPSMSVLIYSINCLKNENWITNISTVPSITFLLPHLLNWAVSTIIGQCKK